MVESVGRKNFQEGKCRILSRQELVAVPLLHLLASKEVA